MLKARTAETAAERTRRSVRIKQRTLAIVRAYQKGDRIEAVGRRFGVKPNSVYQAVGRFRRRCEDAIRCMAGGDDVLSGGTPASQIEPGLNRIIAGFLALKELNVTREQSAKFLSQHSQET